MPFVIFQWDHLRSTSGIICGSIWGSFPVAVGDLLRRCTFLENFFSSSIVVSLAKRNRYLLKTPAISSASYHKIQCKNANYKCFLTG